MLSWDVHSIHQFHTDPVDSQPGARLIAGARFGPKAIRAASGRQSPFRSFGPRMGINPYSNWAKLVSTDSGLE